MKKTTVNDTALELYNELLEILLFIRRKKKKMNSKNKPKTLFIIMTGIKM